MVNGAMQILFQVPFWLDGKPSGFDGTFVWSSLSLVFKNLQTAFIFPSHHSRFYYWQAGFAHIALLGFVIIEE